MARSNCCSERYEPRSRCRRRRSRWAAGCRRSGAPSASRCAPSTSSGCGGGRRPARTRAGRGRRRRRPARRRDVGPSRSFAKPTGSGRRAATRGWTQSVCTSVWAISRRIRLSRSDLTISAGPTWTTPRRAVGSGYTASVERPGPSGGTSRRSGRPTDVLLDRARGEGGAARVRCTRMTATALSPTVIRSGSSVRSTSSARRPMTNGRATASTIRQPAATTISSTQPSSQPAP